MSTQRIVFACLFLFLFLEPGCRGCSELKRHAQEEPSDGGRITRVECDDPVLDCVNKCKAREASISCIDCCLDQGRLCDTQQPYSTEYCDGAR